MPAPKPKRRKGRLLVWLFLGLFAVGAGAGGAWWWSQQQPAAPVAGEPGGGGTDPSDAGAAGGPEQAGGGGEATPADPGAVARAPAESLATDEATPGADRDPGATPEPDPTPAPPPPTTGTVVISGLPRTGRLQIDGESRRGMRHELDAGTHRIRMAAAGWETVVQTIAVRPGETHEVRYSGQRVQQRRETPSAAQAPGVVQILIRPWADVFIDGSRYPEQSRMQQTLSAGRHTIELRREGFRTIDTTVVVQANDTLRLRFRMQRNR